MAERCRQRLRNLGSKSGNCTFRGGHRREDASCTKGLVCGLSLYASCPAFQLWLHLCKRKVFVAQTQRTGVLTPPKHKTCFFSLDRASAVCLSRIIRTSDPDWRDSGFCRCSRRHASSVTAARWPHVGRERGQTFILDITL